MDKTAGGNGGNITIQTGSGSHENDEVAAGFAGDLIFCAGGQVDQPEHELFRIKPNGEVILASNVELTDAANLFWEAVNMVKMKYVTKTL